jgi:hypothetical protein
MRYNYIPYPQNTRQVINPNYIQGKDNRIIGPGNFLFPFALGFVTSPLVYGITRPRPYPYYGPIYRPYPYY